LLDSQWGRECVYLVQDFFSAVLQAIRQNRIADARKLLEQLREPNEVRLGNSKGRPRGSALGEVLAGDVLEALRQSDAVQSGLLQDLEDTVLMIENIDRDRVSDITINIIREPLIRYTQDMARLYGIPLTSGVESGPLWDPERETWYTELVDLPVTSHNKLILVPKAIVRQSIAYNSSKYYRHYIVPLLQAEELAARSSLVELLKNGRARVTKKSIYEKYGSGKNVTVRETLLHPEALDSYRIANRPQNSGPLNHQELTEVTDAPTPDWQALLSSVLVIRPGPAGASTYHKAVEALLTALFYPSLTMPVLERELHSGRKRVDISYTNLITRSSFFSWVGQHYPASNVFVECKNYSKDPANPELDQLQGRFSPSRGKLGLLLFRSTSDKELLIQRCIDTTHDDRGFIIPLDDDDLETLVRARQNGASDFGLLRERFDRLIM